MSRSSLVSGLLVGAVALLATVVMTWPLAANLGVGVQDLGDPLLQIWTLKWDLHQLTRDPLRLYEANIFTPFPQPLAYSESMLATALLYGPLWWLTGDDVVAYNLLVLATFAGSVVTAYLLARQFTTHRLPALLAGLAFAFIPYRFGHLSHLNLLSLQWLPVVLLCLIVYLRGGRLIWAAGFAAAFLAQALSSFYYAYLAAIACAVVVLIMAPWRDGRAIRSRLLGLAAAGLAIALVLVPVSLPYFQVRDTMAFERTAREVDDLAATPKSYLAVAPESRFYEGVLPRRYPNPLFPGAVVAGLAAVGLLARRQRATLMFGALALTGVLFSFGLSLNLAGREIPMPYGLLFEHVPGAQGLRDVARFGVLPLLALPVLAAVGLDWLVGRIAGAGQRRWRLVAAHGLVVVACLVTLAEFSSGFVRVAPVDRTDEKLAVYHWLAEQPRAPVMEFPADLVRQGNAITTATSYMYYSTYHWQPLVLGYSGFVPPLHYELTANFPENRREGVVSHLNQGNVGLLRDLNVRYLLFHRFLYSGDGWRVVQENLRQVEGLTFVGQVGPTFVYLLESVDRAPVRAELLLPNRALAGQPYLTHYVVQNPRSEAAAFAFGGRAELTATWRDGGDRVALTSVVKFQPGMILGPGTRLIPLEFEAPPPGDYRLSVTSPDARVNAFLPKEPLAVSILPASTATATTGEPARLTSLNWPERVYHPGEVIPVAMIWEAPGALPGQVVFFQLVGPDNKVWGQRDGHPLDTRRPAPAWLPGERVDDRRDLPIQTEAPPGAYRILVGLYDPATNTRLPIVGPNGQMTTEVWSDSITIAPPP